jgi:hypothetical protein
MAHTKTGKTAASKIAKLTLQRKLRSIGIVDWDEQGNLFKILRKSLNVITKQLANPNVGLYRREYLLTLRTEFQKQVSPPNRVQVFRGGLPSLGKRR